MTILTTETQRYTLHPIKYNKIWDMYNKQRACFWVPSEIDFSNDYNDWVKLNENEQHFIKNILAFFACADGVVSLNILNNFSQKIKILEAQYTYNYQCTIEGIHNEVYSIMIDTFIKNNEEKNKLFNAIEQIDYISKKTKWAMNWCNGDIAIDLLAFTIMEGLFFSSAFCAIYWIKQRNILKGLTLSNEFIARDERLHTEFACLLFSMCENKPSKEYIYNMIDDALNIEIDFILNSLPVSLIGMKSDSMVQYVKYVADILLSMLGYDKKFNVINPFTFMNTIGIESRSNFFDERSTNYQKIIDNEKILNFVEDF